MTGLQMTGFFPELYILRHGQTRWNAEHRIQGGLDSPLTEKGRAQAREQRRILQRLDLQGFQALSSPQGRARATAEIALAGLVPRIEYDPRLAEIGMGQWEGVSRADLHGGDGELSEREETALHLYDLAPGGEKFAGLEARCRAFMADLDGPAVIVTHGVTSRMLRLIATGRGIDAIAEIGGGQGNVWHVRGGRQDCLETGA